MIQPTTVFYAELQKAYDTFNRLLFDDELPQCLITLQREDRTYGYFSENRFGNLKGEKLHEIALNPTYFAIVPLVEVMQTIVHEMAHLWQTERGRPGRGRYHNAEWANKMEAIGLMPSSTGRPGGARTGDKMGDYPIQGGRFLAACRALLDDDFKIAWYDRFGNDNRLLTPLHAIPATLEQMAEAVHDAVTPADPLGGPAPLLDLPAPATTVAALMGVAMEPRPEKPVNRSNRSKYTCACNISVWGKPGLKIICGECESRFTESA